MVQYFELTGVRRNKRLRSVIVTTILKRKIKEMAGIGVKNLNVTRISGDLARKLAKKGRLHSANKNLVSYRLR